MNEYKGVCFIYANTSNNSKNKRPIQDSLVCSTFLAHNQICYHLPYKWIAEGDKHIGKSGSTREMMWFAAYRHSSTSASVNVWFSKSSAFAQLYVCFFTAYQNRSVQARRSIPTIYSVKGNFLTSVYFQSNLAYLLSYNWILTG